MNESDNEKIKRLKNQIRAFNELMENLSEELTDIFEKGEESQFHDVALEMIKSLDQAQKTVRKAWYLFSGMEPDEDRFSGSGGGP